MRNTFSELAYDITQIIKGSGRVILMYDEDGNRTYDQKNAAKIFAYPDKMMIIITDDGIDSSVDIALSQNTDVLELQDFINTLRHLCTNYNVLFNIQKYGKEIEPKDFANYGNNTSSDLNECLEYYNKNRVINELFKGDDIFKFRKTEHGFTFLTDNKTKYFVDFVENNNDSSLKFFKEKYNIPKNIKWIEIEYGYSSEDEGAEFEPKKDNTESSFKVLNTVIAIINKYIKMNKTKKYCYWFSGNKNNGLAKLYKIICNKIQHENYITDIIDMYNFTTFCLIDKEIITNDNNQVSKINELFKGDSDVEIEKLDNVTYSFSIDNNTTYYVELDIREREIAFSSVEEYVTKFSPTKLGKNQFIVLNTVLKCIKLIFENNDSDYYYFSGNILNGLAKLYSIMFDKLKNNVKKYNLFPIFTNDLYFSKRGTWQDDIDNKYWYFVNLNTQKGKELINAAKEQNLPFVNQLKESRIDELFKGNSNVEIEEMLGTYYFNIDNINYEVYENNSEILFAIGNTEHSRFVPSKNNKNQFLVLNAVIKCVEQILKTKEIYYFSGSNKNGLGKLYSIMFKKLKNKAVSMGYVTLECGEHHFDEDSLFDTDYKPFTKINGEEYFWFIPKEMMTDHVYEEAKKLGIEVTGYN